MNPFGFDFDKIIIIESLPDHERQIRNESLLSSGEYYTQILFPYCEKIRKVKFDFELKKVQSGKNLMSTLDLIHEETKNSNTYPLIHFEVHGREEQDGVTLKNNDFVDWESLLGKLTEINAVTANNLFVIFATCSGAFNLKYIMPRDRVFPYYAALAPDNPDYPIFLEQRYSLFYLDLLIGNGVESAIKEIVKESGHSKIIFSNCEYYLYNAFFNEIKNKNNSKRVDRLINMLKRNGENNLNEKELRVRINKILSSRIVDQNVLENLKSKYLMANHPDNRNRFRFTSSELNAFFEKKKF